VLRVDNPAVIDSSVVIEAVTGALTSQQDRYNVFIGPGLQVALVAYL
jgi:hypothetical protein